MLRWWQRVRQAASATPVPVNVLVLADSGVTCNGMPTTAGMASPTPPLVMRRYQRASVGAAQVGAAQGTSWTSTGAVQRDPQELVGQVCASTPEPIRTT